MGSKATRSTGSRRLKRLLVLGLIGVGAAVYKASRDAATPAARVAPSPAATRHVPSPTSATTATTQAAASTDPVVGTGAEQNLQAGTATSAPKLRDPLFDELPAPVLDEPTPTASLAFDQAPSAPSGAEATSTDLVVSDLHDHVEEPWADAQVTPIAEPPADSLTSFFDEVLTDTAERKLRKGR